MKVSDVEMSDRTSTALPGFLDHLVTFFMMEPASFPVGEYRKRIMPILLRCKGPASDWFTAIQDMQWFSYDDWVDGFEGTFNNPHARDDAIQKMERVVLRSGPKTAGFVAYMRGQQLEAKCSPDNLWPSLRASVPTVTREYLSRSRAYQRHVGPLAVEACFQDLLLAGKQVEESAEDEKHAQQMQRERRRTGNLGSDAGKKKHEPAKQLTTGAGVQKRKRGPRKPKNTYAVSETATTTKPAGKAKGKQLSKAEQDKLKAEKKCFNCKEVGHMANDCPEQPGASKADVGSAVGKVIHADGGDDLMNYGAIPDSPQHSSIHTRI